MDNWLSFVVIALMIIIIPGPDFFIVLNNTLKGNAKMALWQVWVYQVPMFLFSFSSIWINFHINYIILCI